ncbi:MAG: hypothetical protein AAF351_06505 [Pseudomonadota bacterium]
MQEPNFKAFQKDLRRAGIAPRHIKRATVELREHYEDVVAAGRHQGLDAAAARAFANEQFGSLDSVVEAMRAQPELAVWSRRFPRLAMVAYPLACLALIPAVPVFAGVTHASFLARWATCLFVGGLVTALMFLALQLALLFG